MIRMFLISHTSKDLSVMISFREIDNSNQILKDLGEDGNLEFNGKFFKYRIGVVDLDPKQSLLIKQYFDLDKNIVSNFKNYDLK
jgi:hypothetical protein